MKKNSRNACKLKFCFVFLRQIVKGHNAMKTLRISILAIAMAASMVGVGTARAMEAPGANIEVVQQPTVKVVGSHVEITLNGDEPRQVVVYALTGQVVKNVTVQPGVTTIELAAGYYIVKCDRLSQRVIVR
jgi:hypothetical protein